MQILTHEKIPLKSAIPSVGREKSRRAMNFILAARIDRGGSQAQASHGFASVLGMSIDKGGGKAFWAEEAPESIWQIDWMHARCHIWIHWEIPQLPFHVASCPRADTAVFEIGVAK